MTLPDVIPVRVVGISGSPSAHSRSRLLIAQSIRQLTAHGVQAGILIDLNELPADALLARRRDEAVDDAIQQVITADILLIGTPIYRASYTGQLKAFFDLFPQDALREHVVGLIATGAGAGHLLAIDHGLRPLIASLGGLSAAKSVYVTDAQFPDKANLPDTLDAQLQLLSNELVTLAQGIRQAHTINQ